MTRSAALLGLAALALSACGASDEPAPANTASLPPAVAAPSAGDFDAVGTEPFWGLKVRSGTLVLSRPDHSDLTVVAPKPDAIGETVVWWTDAMNVSIMTRECSDGMSDRKYPYTAEVRIGDEVLAGCAARPISGSGA